MDQETISTVSIATYQGLSAAVLFLTALIIALAKIPEDARRIRIAICIGAALLLGFAAKALDQLYTDTSWLQHLLNVAYAAMAASGFWNWVSKEPVTKSVTGAFKSITPD